MKKRILWLVLYLVVIVGTAAMLLFQTVLAVDGQTEGFEVNGIILMVVGLSLALQWLYNLYRVKVLYVGDKHYGLWCADALVTMLAKTYLLLGVYLHFPPFADVSGHRGLEIFSALCLEFIIPAVLIGLIVTLRQEIIILEELYYERKKKK